MVKNYQDTIKHAQDIFGITITPKNLMAEMAKLFPKNEEGCRHWVRGQKYIKLVLIDSSLLYQQWIENGKRGREYFGDDLVEKCWKEIKVLPQQNIK